MLKSVNIGEIVCVRARAAELTRFLEMRSNFFKNTRRVNLGGQETPNSQTVELLVKLLG